MDFIIETIGKLFKRLMIFIGFGIIYKIIEFILDFCDNSVQKLVVIASIIILTLASIIIFFTVRSRKNSKILQNYTTTLKTELKKLEKTKSDLNKKQIDILKNQIRKIDKKNKSFSNTCSELLKEDIRDLKREKQQYDKKYLSVLLTDEYINEIIDFPKGIIYKNNHIEDLVSSEKFGRFTAYVSPNGKVIHLKKNCSQAHIPIDIRKFMHIQYSYFPIGFNPSVEDYIIAWDCNAQYHICQKCGNRNKKYFFQMPKWYEQYLKVQKLKERYEIE